MGTLCLNSRTYIEATKDYIIKTYTAMTLIAFKITPSIFNASATWVLWFVINSQSAQMQRYYRWKFHFKVHIFHCFIWDFGEILLHCSFDEQGICLCLFLGKDVEDSATSFDGSGEKRRITKSADWMDWWNLFTTLQGKSRIFPTYLFDSSKTVGTMLGYKFAVFPWYGSLA